MNKIPEKQNNRKMGGFHTKKVKISVICLFIIFTAHSVALAGGPFGTPQPISKEAGGLHTAIGYWFHEDKYENGTCHLVRQNQIYSEAGYGFKHYFDIYGRIGVSDFKIFDAFNSYSPLTIVSDRDFKESWKFFGTLGAKGFLPINNYFGIGAFIQGTYYFDKFYDNALGVDAGAPFTAELKIKYLWDANFGVGAQATLPHDIKLYVGPYAYYSEAKASLVSTATNLEFGAGKATIKNKTNVGGYAGAFIPLAKGFQLNVEGQYSEKFSAGAAITYTY